MISTFLRTTAPRLAVTAALMTGVMAVAPEARAQDPDAVTKVRPTSRDAHASRSIDLVQGKSVMIDLPRDAKEVFVAAPDIANAVVRTPRKIYVIGLKPGATSVLINDAEGRQIMALEIGVGKEMTRDINILRDVLKQALPNSEIEVRGAGKNIVLSGTVDSNLDAQRAMDIANNMVGKEGGSIFSFESGGSVVNALSIRGKDQVMLKVTVAEIQRTVLKQLGVNFSGTWQVGSKLFGVTLDNPMSLQKQALSNTAIGGTDKLPLVRTLERQGVLRTLAEPTLTAVSGEAAKFLAGGEVPVPSEETCDAVTRACAYRFQYKPIGVSLTFTPLVMSEGRISVRVATEVTELDADNQLTGKNINIPAFRTRRAETTVELPSGGVMATAGLIMQQSKQQINGFPGLMNVPILGSMFRSRDYQRSETELIILVQPFIAKATAAGQIARPDDGFADASDPSTVFMNRLIRTYGQGVARPDPYRGKVGFIND